MAAALLIGAVGSWWAGDAEPAAPAAKPQATAFPWERSNPPSALAAIPAPSEKALRAALPAAVAASGPAVFDICGIARLSAPAGSEADIASGGLDALPAHLGSEPLAQARERMLATLRAGDPQSRVAALLLAQPADEKPVARAEWARAVLQQAQASGSAVALAWAEEACGYLAEGPACRVGLIRERLRLEPDNAHHWAALADEDPEAADEAWRGLMQARRWHAAPQALMLVAQAAMPPDLPPYLRLALGAEVTTRSATLPTPGEGFLMERCSAAGTLRPGDCGALAQLLVERSDSLLALVQGGKLAQLAGWPASRLEGLQRELKSFDQPGVHWAAESGQPLSCASVQAWQQHVADVATLGELGALRSRAVRAAGTGS